MNEFYDILVGLKWKKILWLYHWYHPPNSLILAKFRDTKIIIFYFTCSIVFYNFIKPISNRFSCNHWNWSVVVRLVSFNWTLNLGCALAMFLLIYIIIVANSFSQNTVKTGFSNNFFFISYHIFVFVELVRTKRSWIFGTYNT